MPNTTQKLFLTPFIAASLAAAAFSAWSAETKTNGTATIEGGRYLAQVAGCNDCHTSGYLIAAWASATLRPGSTIHSDGLACFAAVTDAGCAHQPMIVGGCKPKELPMFHWVNTVLGNLKSGLSGAYHAFGFDQYAERYLGAIANRFNRRFGLHALPSRLLVAAVAASPCPARSIRMAETHC